MVNCAALIRLVIVSFYLKEEIYRVQMYRLFALLKSQVVLEV